MKDIYIIMSNQNILKFYRGFIDIKVDNSELYDFLLETTDNIKVTVDNSELYDVLMESTDNIRITVDYSEYFDVELDYSTDLRDYILPNINEIVITSYCDYTILTESDFLINTQNNECIQFEY
jgi:hypothetical protein